MSASAEVLNEDNGDNPNPEAFVGGQGRDDESWCACASEQVYVDSGNKKKILFLMCIGLMFRNNDNEEQPLLLRLQDLQVRAQQLQGIDSETTASGGQGGRRNWREIVPYLRVIIY